MKITCYVISHTYDCASLKKSWGVEVLQCCYSHFYSEKDKLQVCGIIKKKEYIIMIYI